MLLKAKPFKVAKGQYDPGEELDGLLVVHNNNHTFRENIKTEFTTLVFKTDETLQHDIAAYVEKITLTLCSW